MSVLQEPRSGLSRTWADEDIVVDEETKDGLLVAEEKLVDETSSLIGNPSLKHTTHELNSGTVLSSVMNLCACAFGASMLSLPYALDTGGAISALVLLTILGCLATFSANEIIRAGRRAKKSMYAEIVSVFFNNSSLMAGVTEFLLSFCLFLAAVSYIVGLTDILPDMIPISLFVDSSRNFRVVFLTVSIFPLTLVSHMSSFGPSSTLAVAGCFIQALALLFAWVSTVKWSDLFQSKNIHLFIDPQDVFGLVNVLPLMTFLYAYHYILTDTLSELDRPTESRMYQITSRSAWTLYSCYVIVAVSGYFAVIGVQAKIPDNLLVALGKGSILVSIARWSMGILLFATYSLFVIPLRNKIEYALSKYSGKPTELHHHAMTRNRIMICLGLALVVACSAIVLRDLSMANDVAGGCISIIMFVIPGIFGLKSLVQDSSMATQDQRGGQSRIVRWIGVVMCLVIGTLVCFFGAKSFVLNVVSSLSQE